MRVGVPREIKTNEHRVGLTPTAAREYVAHGHEIRIETGAGLGAGFSDADYRKAGAQRLRALEDENGKLKRLLADAMLDKAALNDLLSKKW